MNQKGCGSREPLLSADPLFYLSFFQPFREDPAAFGSGVFMFASTLRLKCRIPLLKVFNDKFSTVEAINSCAKKVLNPNMELL